MKTIQQTDYGLSDALVLKEIEKPEVKAHEVLIRVDAAGLNAADYFTLRGVPYLVRLEAGWPKPKNYVPGIDVAGRVEAIGKHVQRIQPGDAVYGTCKGACAEYVCTAEKEIERIPANLSPEQAAAVPTAAATALRGLQHQGKVRPGHKVLVNGAAGGVGTFAVQIAKALGAEVTGVCSARNLDFVRSIGADHVIDYSRENFTRSRRQYDLILDQMANHPLSDCWRILTPKGVHLPNSGYGGLGYVIKAMLLSWFVRRQGRPFVVNPDHNDLSSLNELIEAGKVTPVIDRTYPLRQTPEALSYLDQMHARGKVVITI